MPKNNYQSRKIFTLKNSYIEEINQFSKSSFKFCLLQWFFWGTYSRFIKDHKFLYHRRVSETATGGFLWKSCSEKLGNIHQKKNPTQVFSSEYFKMFKNKYFEEHLGTTVFEVQQRAFCMQEQLQSLLNQKRCRIFLISSYVNIWCIIIENIRSLCWSLMQAFFKKQRK